MAEAIWQKSIQVLVVEAWVVINENYLHKRKWAGEKKRGETELEEAEKWQIDGGWLWGERDWEKGDLLDWLSNAQHSPDAFNPNFMFSNRRLHKHIY